MASIWTPAEINTLHRFLHLPTSEIYNEYMKARFGIERTYDSIQKKVKSLRDLHKADEILETAKTRVEEALTGAHLAPELTGSLFVPTELISSKIMEWLDEAATQYTGTTYEPEATDGLSLVILLSDNHFGKKTADFNLEIAKQRTLSMVPEIVNSATNIERVDEVVLVLAGDMVEGEDIYANQNGTLECPVIYQAKAATEAYWELALSLRETFQCPVRLETCPGNHGRMSKTADTRSNWDNVVYMMLATLIDQNPELDIHMNLNFNDFSVFRVKDKNLMAYHYGTKHLGTPAMQVKYAGWILGHGIDVIMHGHWHQWGVETYLGRPMVSNGCMCGPDDLAKRMAKEEPARQAYFFVEKDKPVRTFSFVEW